MGYNDMIDFIFKNIENTHELITDLKENIKIEYVESITKRKKDLRTDIGEDDYNLLGSMVIPLPEDGYYYILVNNKLVNNHSLIETVGHELTHLNDYLTFANKYTSSNLEEITKHDYWLGLYFYSEMKAKRIGYTLEFKYLKEIEKYDEAYFKDKIIEIINNTEQIFKTSLDNLNRDGSQAVWVLYHFVRHIGLLNYFLNIYSDLYDYNERLKKIYSGNQESIYTIHNLTYKSVDKVDFDLFLNNLREIALNYNINLE